MYMESQKSIPVKNFKLNSDFEIVRIRSDRGRRLLDGRERAKNRKMADFKKKNYIHKQLSALLESKKKNMI